MAAPGPARQKSPTPRVAWSVHNRLVDAFDKTQQYWKEQDPKHVYYLSAEFLMGRTLTNAVELPDYWLDAGNPWEIRRPETQFKVGFYGSLQDGVWAPGEEVIAEAYDVPIPGYGTKTCSNLRLWDALPSTEFDLEAFNAGDYTKAVEQKRRADDITAVLYPNDATEEGKELRLKQQFFFVSASLQDTIARYLEKHDDLSGLPEKACFQMNDTHPTIAVAELMRLLIDVHGLPYDQAWGITTKAVAYTNHTVMPEALEKWPVRVLSKLLPRHMQLIEQINSNWLESIKGHVTGKVEAELAAKKAAAEEAAAARAAARAAALAAAEAEGAEALAAAEAKAKAEEEEKKEAAPEEDKDALVAELLKTYSIVQANQWNPEEMLVNMAYLAVVGSFAVNGVAAIHSEIIKTDIFPHFVELFPERFQNKTNGVTLRRWLAYCNPELSALITEALGTDAWVRDATLLAQLKPMAEDAAFRARWRAIKVQKKEALAARIKEVTGFTVPTDSMYDVHVGAWGREGGGCRLESNAGRVAGVARALRAAWCWFPSWVVVVDELYRDQEEWTRRSILYTASNGFFSSDRTIDQYAKEIWNVQPTPQP
ncbi:hypothetical protein CHLNCDRAFT_58959 [Chlorella variabilis]|uniref:Alpha-1,4 glucan phosphorylase n=1 Tax=Chlorella variabilis TaxID=554065 RepID=E1ZPG3_CHLVA|nr:hypothetical protein CHLNCDRAFT_58959 [Chlorella variabilis]EFN52353.1 hypothetical protein CHLNCDRAFT_58959 [Chlorella variabilis]|eukprot:XP_005844455.1 hypothetical protein CHLNCDRAFT_58959 [Chlorella variabilis]